MTLSTMLLSIAVFLLTATLAGGAYFVSRAPAVAVALFAAVVWASIGYAAGIGDGRAGIPSEVARWASCALVSGGIVGHFTLRPRASRRSLARAGVGVLVATPVAAAVFAILLLDACPLYVTRRAGYCRYEVDLLGGWVSEVVTVFAIDMIAIAVLLLSVEETD